MKKTKSIARVILRGYVVMIILIMVLGVITYKKASDGLIKNCEDSSIKTITTTADYIKLVTENAQSEANKYINNIELNNYVSGVDNIDVI